MNRNIQVHFKAKRNPHTNASVKSVTTDHMGHPPNQEAGKWHEVYEGPRNSGHKPNLPGRDQRRPSLGENARWL